MKYRISYTNPQQHFIDIEFEVTVSEKLTRIQLPAWRPGRYELGNFAKNIQKWQAYNQDEEELEFEKVTKDCWEVNTDGVSILKVRYNYYSNELNAGSTYLDETQLYVNPVNCLLYKENYQNNKCEVNIDVPEDYQIATGLKSIGNNYFEADNFHQLVDCPLIASNSLQHKSFECNNVLFHLWFQGESKPDFKRIIKDFKKYTNKQIELFGSFPVSEYHYLFQIVPYFHYHGVEHYNSTVISLGPTYDLMEPSVYEELLGVSCHELFHTWNIKAIRPKEMYPYDYKRENYSTLGYVAEGVTTYYGDLMLHRSGVFDDKQYFKILNEQIKKHLDNFARNTYSVAASSFDTWLDGYTKGIPNRKLSIYSDGCLIALITDVMIMHYTKGKKSLDNVMRILYDDFAKKNKGYTDKDYITVVSDVSNYNFSDFFQEYVYGASDYTQELLKVCDLLGLKLILKESDDYYETYYGFKLSLNGIVTDVYQNSEADIKGIAVGDEITHINNHQVKGDLSKWSKFYGQEKVCLVVQRKYARASVDIVPSNKKFFQNIELKLNNKRSREQKELYNFWKNRI